MMHDMSMFRCMPRTQSALSAYRQPRSQRHQTRVRQLKKISAFFTAMLAGRDIFVWVTI